MQSKATTVEDYLKEIPEERKAPMIKLRKLIKKNLPKGFKEGMDCGMMGYCVPHSIYPKGYHVNPKQALPFIGLASQKNNITLYHMCVYGDTKLAKWFRDEYAKAGVGKLDMGKCCIHFKKMDKIPYDLIAELCAKVTVEDWIRIYESNLKR